MAEIANIIKSVRTILDHNVSSSQLAALQDEVGTLDLDTIIKDCIRPAAMQLMQVVPVELATLKTQRQERTTAELPPISIPLPADFLRFVSCSLATWDYPVTELKTIGSREHMREFGEFTGLKATSHRPLAVLDNDTVTLYGGGATRLSELTYIGTPDIGETSIDINDRLYAPLCYIIAALACEVLKDTQKSQSMMLTAKGMLMSAEKESIKQ